MIKKSKTMVVDAREFLADSMTGIGRFLFGLIEAVIMTDRGVIIRLAIQAPSEVSKLLGEKQLVYPVILPRPLLAAEKALANLASQNGDLFVSPYPKLPVFPIRCPAINTVHDVHDITHPAYRYRFRSIVNRFRLQLSLARARLTWFDSQYSLDQASRIVIVRREKARVRHLSVDGKFTPDRKPEDLSAIKHYGLKPGYILVVGNGMPHKNLGVLLSISNNLTRPLVFAGVSPERQRYWRQSYPSSNTVWVPRVKDEDLPALMRSAFCLALPSTAEGYGYPPLEAMACGTSSVVSRIAVLEETSGGKVLLADPHIASEWADRFRQLEDPSVRAPLIQSGLDWVAQRCGRAGWTNHLLDILELLEGLPSKL